MKVSISLEAPPIDLEALDLGIERRCRHSQLHRSAGGSRNLPATLRQRGFDELPFRADQLLVERPFCRLLRGRGRSEPMLVDREFFRVTEDHRSLDDVLQLANVSGPVVRLQQIEALFVDVAEAFSSLGRETLDEVLDQE